KSYRKPAIGVLNKIELCNQEQLKEKQSILNEHFDKTFSISALKDSNFAGLIKEIEGFLPYSPPLYSQEDLSDMPLRFFAQEIIREKIFLEYGDEIPYSSTVVVEKWIEEPDRDVIKANIWIERDSQKPIILGKNGVKIGILRTKSENDIKAFTGRGVSLNLWVKVKPDWRKKNGALKEFGY
ncbi:MAG: KH domain-containing protein, partial [Candidatus Cloacimonetes bacterium]|nr:KH domain-containing protein [Candidatus Cloacimonadota bacterium]